MNYFTIKPSALLAKFVRCFWVLEGEATSCRPYVHRSMADGCAELLFHYYGVFDELIESNTITSFQSGLSGQTQQVRRFTINQRFGMFGVYLYPFTVSHLFSIPAMDLKNQMINLHDLLGNKANALEDKMMLAQDNRERVEIASDFIENKIYAAKRPSPGVFETIRHIIDTNGITSVEELAKRNFLSVRQLERSFLQFTGFNPKLFSRIVRFQSTLENYGSKEKSLTTIAYESGYYDQSHFIQDFKQFSGHNPKEYFSGKTETTVWME